MSHVRVASALVLKISSTKINVKEQNVNLQRARKNHLHDN